MQKVKYKIGSKVYNLELTTGALFRFEEKTGINALTTNIMAEENISAKNTLTLLWACLGKDAENTSPEEIGEKIPVSQLEETFNVIMKLYKAQMPDEKQGAKAKKKK